MGSGLHRWCLAAVALACVVLTPSAHAADANWRVSTPNGGLQYFSTTDRLLADDTDNTRDVYQWSSGFGGLLSLVSPSPVNGDPIGVEIADVSNDGSVLWLGTRERLTPNDTDSAIDIYRLTGGIATLFTLGESGTGNGAFDVTFHAASDDGLVLAFSTNEALYPTNDIDGPDGRDIYARSVTNGFGFISDGEVESTQSDATFGGMTPSGSWIAFVTSDQLAVAPNFGAPSPDADFSNDVYVGRITLQPEYAFQVSVGNAGQNDDLPNSATFGAISDDGSAVWFNSADQLAAGDSDLVNDVYWRSGNTTTRLSLSPTGGNDGGLPATFAGLTPNADPAQATVYFHTAEVLDNGLDLEFTAQDVYARTGSTTEMISTKPSGSTEAKDATFRAASSDGSRVLFDTAEQLFSGAGGDTDNGKIDVYERKPATDTTTLISTDGDNSLDEQVDATFNGAASDGTRVFFTTTEGMVAGDTDNSADIYERRPVDAVTALRSTTAPSAFTTFRSNSATGSRLIFETDAKLVETDGDATRDVYARDTTTNTLFHVSRDLNPPDTSIAAGPGAFVSTATPTVTLSSEPDARFECAIDNSAFSTCTSTFTPPSALADGAHTIKARAKDLDGNVDATPAERSFTVDTAPPDTAIGSAPSGLINTRSAAFAFSSEAGAAFECQIDGGAFAACTSPFSAAALGDGAHTFAVRALDAAGNADPSPASRGFTVDATPPVVTITSGPSGRTTDATPTFAFSSEAGATFTCSLDGAAFQACTSPFTTARLTARAHSFAVRGTDAAGNTNPTAATRSFTVAAPLPARISVRIVARTRQQPLRLRRPAIVLQAFCPLRTCRVRATVVIRLSRAGRMTLRSRTVTARSRRRATLRLTLSRANRVRLARALRTGARRADITVTGTAGVRRGQATRRITLRR